MRERALPLLEAYGVDLVLSGHSHAYERSYLLNGHYGFSSSLKASNILDHTLGRASTGGPYRKPSSGLGANQGAVYVVCGCSGLNSLLEGFPLHPAMALNHGGLGSMVIDVNGLQLTARFLRPSRAIDDAFTIDKTLPATVRPRMEIAGSSNGNTLTWPTSNPSYSLETSGSITAQQWQAISSVPQTIGRRKSLTLPAQDPGRFYRLRADN
jgi:hypothetical protein